MSDIGDVKIVNRQVLSVDWGRLTKCEFDLKLRDGRWRRQKREVYDRGAGACCILFNRDSRTIILARQFRLPVFFLNDHDGYLLEVAAGILEGETPEKRMKQELEEETGYHISEITHLFCIYMSPGSVTEYLEFFVGDYQKTDRVSAGGGSDAEGEDIEALEVELDDALDMIDDGGICDAKTVILVQHLYLKEARRRAAP